MRLYYDLHIHSALSPCASDDMTPNNIVNMCVLKGLDIIAVTDHNSARNVEALSLQRCYGLHVSGTVVIGNGNYVQTFQNAHVHNIIGGHVIRCTGGKGAMYVKVVIEPHLFRQ